MGKAFEDMAARFLEGRGYRLLEQNYHGRLGELDLIARDGDTLVFVEVRMRKAGGWGTPFESLTPRKQKALWRAAERYLAERDIQDMDIRFDAVGITPDRDGPRIELLQNVLAEEPEVP